MTGSRAYLPPPWAVAWMVVMAAAPSARADAAAAPTAAQKETARNLMAEGRARRARHDLKGALESFQAADSIMKVPTTGLEVARTEVALGLLVEARDMARRILRAAPRDDDPPVFHEARLAIQALDDEIAPRIPTLKLAATGAPKGAAMSAELDGLAIPAEAVAAPMKVNPGHHVVVMKAGGAVGRGETDIAAAEVKTLTVSLVATAEAGAHEGDGAADGAAVVADGDRPSTMRTLGWVGMGVAAAGAVAGGVTGVVSLVATSDAKKQCVNDVCPSSTDSQLSTARTMASVSTGCFIGAGAAAVLGLTAFLIGDGSGPSPKGRGAAAVMPWAFVGGGGVQGRF